MARYQFHVFSNPADGREADYNLWYDDVHLGEVLQVPGFVAASRFRLAPDPAGKAPTHAYLAVYEMEVDDPAAALAELTARAGDGRIAMSDALGPVEARLYEVVTERRTA